MRSTPSSRTTVTAVCSTFVGIFAVSVVLNNVGNQSYAAQSTRNAHAERILTCEEVGLCKKGEQGLILNSLDRTIIANAVHRGCRIKRTLSQGMVLRCPAGVAVPNSRAERALRLIDLYASQQIGATDLRRQGITGQGVRVAILDTGADANHPELATRISLTKNFTTVEVTDLAGHGTHVAGIVAGQGVREFEDGGGMNRALGVAPEAELLIGKVCNNQGWCLEGDIMAGIEWAVSQQARVINVSLGGGSFLDHCDDDPLAQHVNWAVKQGVVIVAAAGNSGDAGEGVATPGCASQAIAVGATDATDTRASWSSYGKALDVVAPGVSILSSVSCQSAGTCPTSAYGWWSGTSMASPHAGGLAALLLQADPSLQPTDVYALITGTAKDLGDAGFDTLHGYGRIDAVAALASLNARSDSTETNDLPSAEEPAEENGTEDPASQEQKNNRGDSGNAPEEKPIGGIPVTLPPLPTQAAPEAQEHRPIAPKGQEHRPAAARGSPRW